MWCCKETDGTEWSERMAMVRWYSMGNKTCMASMYSFLSSVFLNLTNKHGRSAEKMRVLERTHLHTQHNTHTHTHTHTHNSLRYSVVIFTGIAMVTCCSRQTTPQQSSDANYIITGRRGIMTYQNQRILPAGL